MAVSLREPWLGGVSIWGQHVMDDLLVELPHARAADPAGVRGPPAAGDPRCQTAFDIPVDLGELAA